MCVGVDISIYICVTQRGMDLNTSLSRLFYLILYTQSLVQLYSCLFVPCLGVPGGWLDIRSLWGLYKMHDTLWFCLVSGLNISVGVLGLCGVSLCRTIRLYAMTAWW